MTHHTCFQLPTAISGTQESFRLGKKNERSSGLGI
jgi:hypothetical protein